MDLDYNKVDAEVLPESNTRVSAAEYNQIAGSCMEIINASGLTPDAADNEQLLNALKAILGPYIVETYSNGTEWYRVWSDGWCEQGGRFTTNTPIVFLKKYSDNNYNLQITSGANMAEGSPTSSSSYAMQYDYKSASGFTPFNFQSNYTAGAYWEAKGFIAQGN